MHKLCYYDFVLYLCLTAMELACTGTETNPEIITEPQLIQRNDVEYNSERPPCWIEFRAPAGKVCCLTFDKTLFTQIYFTGDVRHT